MTEWKNRRLAAVKVHTTIVCIVLNAMVARSLSDLLAFSELHLLPYDQLSKYDRLEAVWTG